MGTDIYVSVETLQDGKWTEYEGYQEYDGVDYKGDEPVPSKIPFDYRSYSVFGFFAGVRNYSAVTPIMPPRGLPSETDVDVEEYKWSGHTPSWLTVRELIDFDYEQVFEDRRHNGSTLPVGEGKKTTYRDFLGQSFFTDLETLRSVGDPDTVRIVFWFD